MDRLRLGVRVQHTLSDLTTNLALGKVKRCLPALDFVAKEFEALLDMNDPRLLQLFQDAPCCIYRGTCLCCRFTGDHPIIGKPRQLISSQPHLPIKRRQKYVTEKGRNHAPYTKGNFDRLGLRNPRFAVQLKQSECCDEW